jgi:hypothetical protein
LDHYDFPLFFLRSIRQKGSEDERGRQRINYDEHSRNSYLFRNCFSGRLDAAECYKWFPEAKAIDERRMPSVDGLRAIFAEAGFEFVALEPVRQVIDPDLMAHYERLNQRAVSTFELMEPAAVEAGLDRMRRAAERETTPRPITEDIDLLVLRVSEE